ncbi:hypothetical protein F4808DRAFT_408914 [Astrocystis sublimbata]|nr:hypothetical protein F4808DRAFT_408914 [Astrocystis sublimbata]
MAAKAAYNPLAGMHTAGIFSDMSIDGPEIGTLVLIVDRAKNLPNRKTIGKQDPYCAARLGKEAKKTATDVRGGQTPKWDQELRFTVHDSPDYYQLKLSIYNDDKKTEMIGETWIDLRSIIVIGGGQSDQWHNLSCKGKYAGNIRIEITYYDQRPKPEKPAAKPKPVGSAAEQEVAGPRPIMKRRPLPSDPVTGQAPAPAHAPEPVNTPPRAQPMPPSGPIPSLRQSQPAVAAEYSTPPPNRHVQPDYQSPAHSPAHGVGYQHPSPLRDHQLQRGAERPESFHAPQYETDPYYQSGSPAPRAYEADSRAVYNNSHSGRHPQPLLDQHRRSIEDSGPPPPPPAHRVRNSTGHLPDANATAHAGYEVVQHKTSQPMLHDVLRNEAHRYSNPSVPSQPSAYPGRPTYRPYDSAPSVPSGMHDDHNPDLSMVPRHQSYDSSYKTHPRQMQPTVEDVPESWTPPQARNRHSMSHYEEPEYDPASSPAPLNITSHGGGHGSVSHEQYSRSPSQSLTCYGDYEQSASPTPIAPVEYSQALTHVPRSQTYQVDHYHNQSSDMDHHVSSGHVYNTPAVPATLVPGVDPGLAREVSDRIYQERRQDRRYTQPTQMVVHSRGRQHSEPPSNSAASYSPHGQLVSSRGHERAQIAYSSGPNTPSAAAESSDYRRVSPSPNPNHTIKRKSVSPAPPPSEPRRLSGVPFGPDSYDTFNPSVSREGSKSADYTSDGKIRGPDGREIDPSDHLPMDTWAPEPEPKKPVEQTESRSRPTLNGAQPMPPSGRRQLRITARPHSTAFTPAAYGTPEPAAPSSTGRNRLVKKDHRVSALPAPVSASSRPLAPATAHQRNSTPPRALVHASTFDYENHGPSFDGDYGTSRGGYGSGPPIPAKVPMMSGGLVPYGSAPRRGEDMALMEEMSRIDIGSGRARRHGGY